MVIANGFTDGFWAWALPGAVIAGNAAAPMLLVETDELFQDNRDLLDLLEPDAVLTIGPESLISAATAQDAVRAAKPMTEWGPVEGDLLELTGCG